MSDEYSSSELGSWSWSAFLAMVDWMIDWTMSWLIEWFMNVLLEYE